LMQLPAFSVSFQKKENLVSNDIHDPDMQAGNAEYMDYPCMAELAHSFFVKLFRPAEQ
jgi:hypothetical protein